MAEYVIREHHRGRSLTEILDDAYVRTTVHAGADRRLLDRPEVVHALGEDIVAAHRSELWADARSPRELDDARAGGEVPRRDPVRLEDHDVVGRGAALQLARRRPPGARAPRASRARRAATGSIRSPDSSAPARASRSRRTRPARARRCRARAATGRSRRRRTRARRARATRRAAPGRASVVTVTTTSCSAASRCDSAASQPFSRQNAARRSAFAAVDEDALDPGQRRADARDLRLGLPAAADHAERRRSGASRGAAPRRADAAPVRSCPSRSASITASSRPSSEKSTTTNGVPPPRRRTS